LVVNARQLGNLVDEIQESCGNSDYFIVHDLEEFAEQESCGLDEIDRVDLLLRSFLIVGLNKQEIFHIDVAVLAEQLQEAEDTAKCQFISLLSSSLKLIKSGVTKLLQNDIILHIEVVEGIHNAVSEFSQFSDFFGLSDFNQESADVVDQSADTEQHVVFRVFQQNFQKRFLAMSVSVEEISDAQKKDFVQQLSLGVQILVVVFVDGFDELGAATLFDQILPLNKFAFSLSWWEFLYSTVVVSIPLVHWQFVVLLSFDSLSDVASGDFDDEYLLLIFDGLMVVHDEAEGFRKDLLERNDWDGLFLLNFQPLLLIVLTRGAVDAGEGRDQLVELVFTKFAENR
jgi:glycerol-3-phosphate responsive antiterminator